MVSNYWTADSQYLSSNNFFFFQIVDVRLKHRNEEKTCYTKMPHCSLCGLNGEHNVLRPMCPVSTLHFLKRNCKDGGLLYERIFFEIEVGKPCRYCIACVNWRRRMELRKTVGLLPIEQLALYILRPGYHGEPDRRCVQRLVNSIRNPQFPFRDALPAPVRTIVDQIKTDDMISVIESWWWYNDNTTFFESSHQARKVRWLTKHFGTAYLGIQ
jgi:hypothetical protein